MRTRFLTFWANISSGHPFLVTAGSLLVTILAVILASGITVTTSWSDLLPENDLKVQEFDSILDDYTSVSNSIIVIQGEEHDIKRLADEIAPQIRAMTDDVERLHYKLEDKERDFIVRHGFMLTKETYLKNMPEIFQDLSLLPFLTHLNDDFERVYVGDEESLSSIEKENNAVRTLDGIQYWLESMGRYARAWAPGRDEMAQQAAERLTLGDPYFISHDKRMLLMVVEPNFSMLDIDRSVAHVDSLQSLVDRMLRKYPGVRAGLTGTVPLGRDEMVYSMHDMQTTSLLGLTLILILFIISFRMFSTPVLAAINLLMGIIWTLGVSSFFISSLNIMTSMFGVILIGLGIDFSIHIISIYNEQRHRGVDIPEAVRSTLLKSGAGIVTGGLTTACAFFTLMISDTRGIKEMGLILGIGILCTMLATILVFPSILVVRERIILKVRHGKIQTHSVDFGFLGQVGAVFYGKPVVFLSIGILLTGFLVYQALNAEFDYNYLNSEPKGIPSVTLQDSLVEAFDMVSDIMMTTADNADRVREITEEARDLGSVGLVQSITDYLPSAEQQHRRKPYVKQIHDNLMQNGNLSQLTRDNVDELIGQLERLDMNIYELAQMAFIGGQDRVDRKAKSIIGDPEDSTSVSSILALAGYIASNPTLAIKNLNLFQRDYEPHLRRLGLKMSTTTTITMEGLPEQITSRFFSRDKDRLLVTIYPKENIWDFQSLDRINLQMERVDPSITGMPIMFRHLVSYIGRDGKISTILTLVVVFLLLLLDFRSLKMGLLGMIPLVVGVVWMVGIMHLVDLKLTFVNVVAIPMIVGIGIDDGVHFLHRYRVEGRSRIREVMSSTGKALLLTSLTTMAGFGSLMIAQYRGFVAMGALLVIGVGACFLTTVFLLPSIIGLVEGKSHRE